MSLHYHRTNDPAYREPPRAEREADQVLRQYGNHEFAKVERLKTLIERFVDDVELLDIKYWQPTHHDIEHLLDMCRECMPGDKHDIDVRIEELVRAKVL